MKKITIERKMIINKIAMELNMDSLVIESVLNSLEGILFRNIQRTNEKVKFIFKLFEGMSLETNYQKEKQKTNNLTHENILVNEKIKIKWYITRTYKEKINQISKYNDIRRNLYATDEN